MKKLFYILCAAVISFVAAFYILRAETNKADVIQEDNTSSEVSAWEINTKTGNYMYTGDRTNSDNGYDGKKQND